MSSPGQIATSKQHVPKRPPFSRRGSLKRTDARHMASQTTPPTSTLHPKVATFQQHTSDWRTFLRDRMTGKSATSPSEDRPIRPKLMRRTSSDMKRNDPLTASRHANASVLLPPPVDDTIATRRRDKHQASVPQLSLLKCHSSSGQLVYVPVQTAHHRPQMTFPSASDEVRPMTSYWPRFESN